MSKEVQNFQTSKDRMTLKDWVTQEKEWAVREPEKGSFRATMF